MWKLDCSSLMGINELHYATTMQLHDALRVKNILVNSVWYITEYIICNLDRYNSD
jgi:hypothetical protein